MIIINEEMEDDVMTAGTGTGGVQVELRLRPLPANNTEQLIQQLIQHQSNDLTLKGFFKVIFISKVTILQKLRQKVFVLFCPKVIFVKCIIFMTQNSDLMSKKIEIS